MRGVLYGEKWNIGIMKIVNSYIGGYISDLTPKTVQLTKLVVKK